MKTLISKAEGGRKETKSELAILKSEVVDFKKEMQRSMSHLIESLAKPATEKSTIPSPECPICFEEMKPPMRIIQCKSGHLICRNCETKAEVSIILPKQLFLKSKSRWTNLSSIYLQVTCSPICKQEFTGRAFGMENYLRTINEHAGVSRAAPEIPCRPYTFSSMCITSRNPQ